MGRNDKTNFLSQEFVKGEQIFPEINKIHKEKIFFYFQLILFLIILINFIKILIFNNLIAAFIYSILVIFMAWVIIIFPRGIPTFFENGIKYYPSIYRQYFRKIPKWISFKDIDAITPNYKCMKKELKIQNFKVILKNSKKEIILPNIYSTFKIIEIKNQLPVKWHSLFDEDYDVKIFQFKDIENFISFNIIKFIIKYLIISFSLFFSYLLFIAIFFYLKFEEIPINSDDFNTSLFLYLHFFLVVFQLGLMRYTKFIKKLIPLQKYIYFNRISEIPSQYVSSEKFKKWISKNKINEIERLDTIIREAAKDQKYLTESFKKDERKRRKKYRFALISIVITIIVGIFCIYMFGSLYGSFKDNYQKDKIPNKIDSQIYISSTKDYSNTTLYLSNNFVIAKTGSITMENVEIVWELEKNGPGFYVEKGGEIYARNCSFYSIYSTKYKFEIQGNGSFINCSFEYLWGENIGGVSDGGVEIYNDNVTLENCLIIKSRKTGLIIGDCSPKIINTTIINSGGTGMKIFGGKPVIKQCNISKSKIDGIKICKNSKAEIVECHITENDRYGIYYYDSDPHLDQNVIKNNSLKDVKG